MSINHRFVSAKPDSADATLINPSNWNATHSIGTPAALAGSDGLLTGVDVAGELTLNGIKATGALQRLRRNNANTAFEFVSPWQLVSTDFNFTPQSPGGSLVVGSNTITLNPMPPGINATSILQHKLRIAGGVGIDESVLITGWTATTVTVTCAGTHSGNWTIGSATVGLQEAIRFVSVANG